MKYDTAKWIVDTYSKESIPGGRVAKLNLLGEAGMSKIGGVSIDNMDETELARHCRKTIAIGYSTYKREQPEPVAVRPRPYAGIDSETLGMWAAEATREASVSEDEKQFKSDQVAEIVAELSIRKDGTLDDRV
ncbi:hypothetical protein ACFL96_15600 [Thermoproteota archaeon]